MPSSKSRWTFPLFLWILVAALAFYLLCWPLIHNAWALNHWERVPCVIIHLKSDDGQEVTQEYTFSYHNKVYHGMRIDFWDIRPTANAYFVNVTAPKFDSVCYVPPGDPNDAFYHAVLNLDAPQHLDHAGKGLIIVVFASCVAIILSVVAYRKGRNK